MPIANATGISKLLGSSEAYGSAIRGSVPLRFRSREALDSRPDSDDTSASSSSASSASGRW